MQDADQGTVGDGVIFRLHTERQSTKEEKVTAGENHQEGDENHTAQVVDRQFKDPMGGVDGGVEKDPGSQNARAAEIRFRAGLGGIVDNGVAAELGIIGIEIGFARVAQLHLSFKRQLRIAGGLYPKGGEAVSHGEDEQRSEKHAFE